MQTGPSASRHGLDKLNLKTKGREYWNLTPPALYEEALKRGEGSVAEGGAFVAITGEHTGRSPHDKFIVEEAGSQASIDWGKVNRPIAQAKFDGLHRTMLAHLGQRDLFVLDCYGGADPSARLKVRVVTETAWHSLFARNMFIRVPAGEQAGFVPDFTILHAPSLLADPKTDTTRSGTFVLLDFGQRLVLIGGTSYAGEIKKSVFSILSYLLPAKGILPMHCSANIGPKGDTAIFFGLSGTGKTTLSADSARTLIGDDEHGWSADGIFNFEGGCYAKVIKLSPSAEPEIHATTGRFGTVLENVVMDPATRSLDLDDARYTENTRACYPVDFIPNMTLDARGGHPQNIVMLTADAFGVLPPVSQLTSEQAMYHFLSGYTARVAGTEKGLGKEPQATFSSCFGAPFMARHPTVYARLLGEKIAKHGAKCWLVNTGWSGGAYGVGERMKIAYTRAMIRAILDGRLSSSSKAADPNFGMLVPQACPDVPADVLNPKNTWRDKAAYDSAAREVAKRFEQNFQQFETLVDDRVKAVAIRAAA